MKSEVEGRISGRLSKLLLVVIDKNVTRESGLKSSRGIGGNSWSRRHKSQPFAYSKDRLLQEGSEERIQVT